MPDLNTHLNNAYILITGIVSGLIGFGFDVQAATLWTAAFGACIGVAFKPPVKVWHGFAIIILGGASVGLLVPLITSSPPKYPEKSLAFLLAVVLIGGRNLLPAGIEQTITAGFNRLAALISTWGPKQ
ncbi:MAG: hypothetical protein B7X95_01380 [Methylophilaceae bacterium 17-44-8]|nr:MAG: hypothetical protein B7X95_01380 [Methylophilaceae bacterium 17-44-8]